MTATQALAEALKKETPGIQKLGNFVGEYLDAIGEIRQQPLAIAAVVHRGRLRPVGVHVQPDMSISVVAPDIAFRVMPQQQCIDEYKEDGRTDIVENLSIAMLAGAKVLVCLVAGEEDSGRYVVLGMGFPNNTLGLA